MNNKIICSLTVTWHPNKCARGAGENLLRPDEWHLFPGISDKIEFPESPHLKYYTICSSTAAATRPDMKETEKDKKEKDHSNQTTDKAKRLSTVTQTLMVHKTLRFQSLHIFLCHTEIWVFRLTQ